MPFEKDCERESVVVVSRLFALADLLLTDTDADTEVFLKKIMHEHQLFGRLWLTEEKVALAVSLVVSTLLQELESWKMKANSLHSFVCERQHETENLFTSPSIPNSSSVRSDGG